MDKHREQADATRPAGRIRTYCAQPALTGAEKPEHPLPAALGSSLEVYTACDPCNEWAAREIDQPFLADDWLRLHRSDYNVRDPRRSKSRRVASPFKRGFTADGVRVTIDDEWRPHLGAKIIDNEETGEVTIQAGSAAEAERLLERVRKRAAAEGKTVVFGSWKRAQVRP
jgi:hypothetical protein